MFSILNKCFYNSLCACKFWKRLIEEKTAKAKKMQKTHAMTQTNTRKSVTLIRLLAKVTGVITQQTFVLMKTSFVFVFRRRLQDVLIKANIFAIFTHLQKTSWSRPTYSSWSYVFTTFSGHLAKMSSRRLAKTSSRRLHKYTDHKFLRSVTEANPSVDLSLDLS